MYIYIRAYTSVCCINKGYTAASSSQRASSPKSARQYNNIYPQIISITTSIGQSSKKLNHISPILRAKPKRASRYIYTREKSISITHIYIYTARVDRSLLSRGKFISDRLPRLACHLTTLRFHQLSHEAVYCTYI